MPIQVFTVEALNACAEENRKFAYTQETDPMFMQVQRGDMTMAEWTAAVQVIKDRFPYATEDLEVEYPEPAEQTNLEPQSEGIE